MTACRHPCHEDDGPLCRVCAAIDALADECPATEPGPTERAERLPVTVDHDEARSVECLWTEEHQDACRMCSGEVCSLCGAGCWNNDPDRNCQHDVSQRHTEVVGGR